MDKWVAKKKNCFNCKYLDYFMSDYESNDGDGYSCEAREYKNEGDEYKHLEKLNSAGDYLARSKKCCELVIK